MTITIDGEEFVIEKLNDQEIDHFIFKLSKVLLSKQTKYTQDNAGTDIYMALSSGIRYFKEGIKDESCTV